LFSDRVIRGTALNRREFRDLGVARDSLAGASIFGGVAGAILVGDDRVCGLPSLLGVQDASLPRCLYQQD